MDQPGFLNCLTDQAKEGEFRTSIGREKEIKDIINKLAEKNIHPLLLGPPGVGKTQLVQSVALELVRTGSPFKIYELDQISFSSDTKYVGQTEEKMRDLLAFAKSEPNAVFFIDEFHSMIGRGSHSGKSSGIEQQFKPAMTNGTIKIIAATTESEYQRDIAPDAAMARRFALINIASLNSNSTFEVIALMNREDRVLGKPYFSDQVLKTVVTESDSIKTRWPFGEPSRSIKLYYSLKSEFQSISGQGMNLKGDGVTLLKDIFSKLEKHADPKALRETLAKNFTGKMGEPADEKAALACLKQIVNKISPAKEEVA